MGRLTLLKQFSIISLVLFLAIGAILGWGLTHHFEQQAIGQQSSALASLVQPLISDYLTEDVLKNGAPAGSEAFKRIEANLGFIGGSSGLVIVRIWSRDGVIIYSDSPQEFGARPQDQPNVTPITAVGGRPPIADNAELLESYNGATVGEISSLTKAENAAEQGYGELLEIYTPIRQAGSDKIKAVFEGYFDVEDLRAKINATNEFLWASIGTGFVFLYVTLFTLVRNASQRILRQSRENELLLADTARKAARLEVVNELARSINSSSLNLEDVFQTALSGIDRILSHTGASIAHLDERTGAVLSTVLSQGASHGENALSHLDIGLAKRLLEGRDIFLARDARVSGTPELIELSKRGVLSLVLVSISLGDKRLGLLCVVSNIPNSFNEEDADILKGVADQLAVAIENSRLIKETAETTALRETNRLKDEFVSMVSHELRTPLASIKGYSRTLLAADGNWDAATRAEFLEIISDESDKLTDLVENLLEMSRIDARRLPITPEPILLKRFCKEVVERVCNHYPEIEFQCNLDGYLPVVSADPRRVEQVLVNLLQNAAKYSGAPLIQVRGSYEGGKMVKLSIEDNGAGIAAEHIPHLFEKFFRVEGGQAHNEVGTGLGLAIVKALVEAQGGEVWVESAPGEGTRFFFTLPVLAMEEEEKLEPVGVVG